MIAMPCGVCRQLFVDGEHVGAGRHVTHRVRVRVHRPTASCPTAHFLVKVIAVVGGVLGLAAATGTYTAGIVLLCRVKAAGVAQHAGLVLVLVVERGHWRHRLAEVVGVVPVLCLECGRCLVEVTAVQVQK